MRRWLLSLALAVSLAGCSAAADTKAAEEGVASFHSAMDARRYSEIYDSSSKDMKSSITRDDFAKFMESLHLKLGPYKSGKTVGWHVNVGTGGKIVTLRREAQFARGPGSEEFVFRVENGRPILVGYHVNSRLLVTG